MAPVAIRDATDVLQSTLASTKAAVNGTTQKRTPLPDHGVPVAPDFMYKFDKQRPLPTHSADFLEIPQDTNIKSVATDFVSQLSKVLTAGDAAGFADLFLEQGIWKDRIAFTWDYRTFNFKSTVKSAATDLLPDTPVSNVTLIDPAPTVERPYKDLSYVMAHVAFDTDVFAANGVATLISTPTGWKIWYLTTTIESLHNHPELPERDGHMTGPHAWDTQRAIDNELEGVEPEVLIVGGGQNGLMTAARLKALGISSVIIERNGRIGDNWRGRYEALSLHLPNWADEFPYMPYPKHWPRYCPAAKLADWFEWYVSAMELDVWTASSVVGAKQDASGQWSIDIERRDGKKRTFQPKQLILATSLAGVPFSPTIPGRDEFKGTVRHSTQHDSSRDWVGKKVLVVGTSSSGFDTAFDFARRDIDVTLLQRSPTFIMSLDHSVPRVLGLYKPDDKGRKPNVEIADRINYATPLGAMEPQGLRLQEELTDLDYDLLQALEAKGFKTWRGQRSTMTQTLGFTKNGGFYFDAGACEQILNGKIKVEQGYIDHFTKDKVVLNGDREQEYDLVVLATGFSNTIDSVRAILGEELASKFGPIWGMDEEGELNSAWKTNLGLPNTTLMVGTLQAARYHSQKIALRIKAQLEGIAREPYTKRF